MTKDEVHYRLPDVCCANCLNSFLSSYGDVMCTRLSGTTIDGGAVCDRWTEDTKPVTHPVAVQEVVKAQPLQPARMYCGICVHGYMKDNICYCDVDETIIADLYSVCHAFEEDNDYAG